MPSGVYKHKSPTKREDIKARSLGFRDGRLLDEIEQICKNPLMMNLVPDHCKGRIYKTIWWGMKYLMKMVESRTIRREVPLFPDDADSVEVNHLRQRITELETIEAGNIQTIDDLTKQLNKKNTEIARLKQVNYTVNWGDVVASEKVSHIINTYRLYYGKKKERSDGNIEASEILEELYKYKMFYETVYACEHGEIPSLDRLEQQANELLRKKKGVPTP